jgi:hypothetical protein
MSWQAWLVLAVVLTVGALAFVIASIGEGPRRGAVRARVAAVLGALAGAAYVVAASIAWPT